jgi:hypothetical protein
MMRLGPWRLAALSALLITNGMAAATDDSPLPDLAWVKRSDWIDVKAENPADPWQPTAVGDGKADDTDVLQAALNKLKQGATLYLPPGTYRITQTLEASRERLLGISVIGHGRSTVLVWDGPAGQPMFRQRTGCALSRFVGLTWDGRGKADAGMDFGCMSYFETEQRFQHCAFLNFTDSGIRMGKKFKLATAETVYDNCYFADCKNGISLLYFNYLDHTVIGCEFRRCGVGIMAGKGSNFYARECRFEGSRECDVSFGGEGGSSVRRCTSQGSKQFINDWSLVGTLAIQDCRVDAWKDNAAIAISGGAPVVLFDTVFTRPPSNQPPVFANHAWPQRLIVSNNKAEGCKALSNHALYEIPPGARGGVLSGPEQTFFRSNVHVAARVFDAKRDFGARGDGKADDTAAIQKAIDAARAEGKGALAYLPKGLYAVTTSLRLTGADYTFGGSGFGTALVWKGPAGGTTIRVSDAERLTLANMSVGRHDYPQGENEADIVQTGRNVDTFRSKAVTHDSGKSGSGLGNDSGRSTMCYDRVWVYGMYMMKPTTRGFRAENLTANDRVYFKEFNGNIRLADSADATVLLGTTYEGTLLVEGKSLQRGGFLGAGVRLGTVTDPGLWVKDNHSFVVSDFYVESSRQLARLEGDATLPPGRVTLQGAKFEIDPKSPRDSVEINGYAGALVAGTYLFYPGNAWHRFKQSGNAPFSLTVWGGCFYNCKPEVTLGTNATFSALGNNLIGWNPEGKTGEVASTVGIVDSGTGAVEQIRLALDDLRRLGAVEAEFVRGAGFGE